MMACYIGPELGVRLLKILGIERKHVKTLTLNIPVADVVTVEIDSIKQPVELNELEEIITELEKYELTKIEEETDEGNS